MPNPPVGGIPNSSAWQEALVNRVGSLVPGRPGCRLSLEPGPLVERIVELRERVHVLGAGDVELETLHQALDIGIDASGR